MNVFCARDNMSGWVDTWACVWVTLKNPRWIVEADVIILDLLPTSLPPGRKKHEDQKVTKEKMIFRRNYVICSILLSVLDHPLRWSENINVIIPITARGLPAFLPCYTLKQLPWQVLPLHFNAYAAQNKIWL